MTVNSPAINLKDQRSKQLGNEITELYGYDLPIDFAQVDPEFSVTTKDQSAPLELVHISHSSGLG